MQPLTCPRCRRQFGSTNRLSRHLKSRTRRFRCGIFTQPVDFTCECGRSFNSIRMIKAHLTRDHTKPHHTITQRLNRDCALDNSRKTHHEIGFYNEDGDSVAEHTEQPAIIDSADSSSLSDGNADCNTAALIPPASFCYGSFVAAVNGSRRLRGLMQLYKYCLASGVTVRAYRQLVELDVIDTTFQLPKQRRALRALIMDCAEETSGWVTLRSFTLPDYQLLNISPTPFMTVMDALRIWLSLPIVLTTLRDSMMKHLPDNLIDLDSYDEMIDKQARDVTAGIHIYENVADGSEYLPSIRACVPKFRNEYIRALEDDIEVILCTVAFFDDCYRKQKDSLVNQQIFCLTLLEAAVGEASLTNLASLIMMIADANGTKELGGDIYWKVLVDEMCTFERGVRIMVEGKVCLIICIGMFLLADTLALKAMAGLSPSISSTCYVRMPCRTCEVLMEDLSTSLQRNFTCPLRSIDTYDEFFRYNDYATGTPMSGWLKEMMKQYGILRISEFMRLTGLMSPRKLGTDLLHAVYLGALKHHFTHVVELLTSAEHGCKKTFVNVWKSISSAFHSYCKKNGISSCWKFSSLKEFKSRVKGGSMRELARVSPFLFRAIRLVDLDPFDDRPATVNKWKKHIRVFNFWVLHVKIAGQLEHFSITSEDLNALEDAIKHLLQYFHDDFVRGHFPKFATINVHYYIHIIDQIRWMGPMRIASNDVRERLIQWLKFRYKNTAATAKEISVYQIYLDSLFFQVQNCVDGDDLTHRREVLPCGVIMMDCFRHDMIVIDDGLTLERWVSPGYDGLMLMFDNTNAAIKLHYCDLRRGKFIMLSRGCGLDSSYVACLMNIVYYQDQPYIAHCLPMFSSHQSYRGTSFTCVTINNGLNETVLYLCPLNRFVSDVPLLSAGSDDTVLVI